MRELTGHQINDLNNSLKVTVLDEPGPGNACHRYTIAGPDRIVKGFSIPGKECEIHFQNGPVNEHGINGISDESLLVVLIDRLAGFQAGPYSCRENAVALTHLESGLLWLQKRTRDRQARGVEGTMQK